MLHLTHYKRNQSKNFETNFPYQASKDTKTSLGSVLVAFAWLRGSWCALPWLVGLETEAAFLKGSWVTGIKFKSAPASWPSDSKSGKLLWRNANTHR